MSCLTCYDVAVHNLVATNARSDCCGTLASILLSLHKTTLRRITKYLCHVSDAYSAQLVQRKCKR